MKEIKFKIIEGYLNPMGSRVKDIEKEVEQYLGRGWERSGNIVHLGSNKFAQVMVKRTNNV